MILRNKIKIVMKDIKDDILKEIKGQVDYDIKKHKKIYPI